MLKEFNITELLRFVNVVTTKLRERAKGDARLTLPDHVTATVGEGSPQQSTPLQKTAASSAASSSRPYIIPLSAPARELPEAPVVHKPPPLTTPMYNAHKAKGSLVSSEYDSEDEEKIYSRAKARDTIDEGEEAKKGVPPLKRKS